MNRNYLPNRKLVNKANGALLVMKASFPETFGNGASAGKLINAKKNAIYKPVRRYERQAG